MLDKLSYYTELLITLCGYDGSNDTSVIGIIVVVLSALIVIYTFYFAITQAVWPEHNDPNHIKNSILEDGEEVTDAH